MKVGFGEAGEASAAALPPPMGDDGLEIRSSVSSIGRAGVSALRRGGWSLRLVAPDSVKLRQGLRDVRRILAAHFPRLAADLRKI